MPYNQGLNHGSINLFLNFFLGFGQLTRLLGTLAGGKVALVLEGGYDLASICDSSEECVRALLGDPSPQMSEETLLSKPNFNCVQSLEEVVKIQSKAKPFINIIEKLVLTSWKKAKFVGKQN